MQINDEQAQKLVVKYLKNRKNQLHSRESEVVLRALAKELRANEEVWGIAGLIHDLDWEQTEDNPAEHGVKTLDILENERYKVLPIVSHAISSHNEKYTGVKREGKLDFALAAGESITGLIYAYALMRPDKLAGMKVSSLNKKFKDKSFATNVSRELITDIEKIGLERSKFFELAITAMQKISAEIGL